MRKSKREKPEAVPLAGSVGQTLGPKKQRRRVSGKGVGHVGSSSSIQSLLTAASLLEDDSVGGVASKTKPTRRKSDLWNADKRSELTQYRCMMKCLTFHPCSPWTDKYETAEENLYTEAVHVFLESRIEQLKSEEVVYSREEYVTSVVRPHPQCMLMEVGQKRKGLVLLDEAVPQDELVIECKVRIS